MSSGYYPTGRSVTPGSPRARPPLPGRLFHPAYRDRFHFGAVTLRPGMTVEEIGVTLRAVVADADA